MDKLNQLYHKHLNNIRQLSLEAWMALAEELGVACNDREHAAKKLAIRELTDRGSVAADKLGGTNVISSCCRIRRKRH